MFKTTSKTAWGATLVTVLAFIFPTLGIDVPEDSIAGFVNALATVVGFVLMIYGQFDREDIAFFFWRKDPR